MKYTKPEVRLLACAVDAIQSSGKGSQPHADSPLNVTVSAYEADE